MPDLTPPASELAPGDQARMSGFRELHNVEVPVRDGCILRANVFLGADDKPRPVVMAMTTYGKDLPFSQGYPDAWQQTVAAAPEMLDGTSARHISFEAVDPERWVPFGYAVVLVDSRGTGASPGTVDSLSATEGDDLHDAIEWAAGQAWSNGLIGLVGMSYLGNVQWLAASRRPPHLAAIIPWEAYADSLRDLAYHGGIPSDFYSGWYESQVKSVQHGAGDQGYRNVFTGELVSGPGTVGEAERRRLAADTDIYRQTMQHPLDEPMFWDTRRAQWENIDIPLLSAGSWGAVGVHLRGNVEGFVRAASSEKWLVLGPTRGGFASLYGNRGVALQRAFFDATLKNTGDWRQHQPPVQVDVRGLDNEVAARREGDAWPLRGTRFQRLYLDLAHEALAEAPASGQAARTYTAGETALTLRTSPFAGTLDIVGPVACRLFISSATMDADLFLILHAIGPDGHERFFPGIADPRMPLSQGWLRASQRELDVSRSKEWAPFLSHQTTRPLVPGDCYQVDVEIWPTCVRLPPGSRLGLSIQGHDFDHGQPAAWSKGGRTVSGSSIWTHRDPVYRPKDVYGGEVTVFCGADTPSHLLLPTLEP